MRGRTFKTTIPDELAERRRDQVNREFTVLGDFVVPGPRFAGLMRIPRERLDGTSLRDVLAQRFDAPTLRVEEQISFTEADDSVCAAINLPRGSLALQCHVLGFGIGDAPVYSQMYHIPPNRRRLEMRERMP